MATMEHGFTTKVSIIVPVYNTAEYLRQCLDTILKQTLTNIEIICVDDGSTDGSIEILYEYAAKDGRVQVIRQENQTAGAARNRGLEVAKGEYLLFLDSDDFFMPDLAETAYQLAKEKDADVVIFGADNFDDVEKKHIAAPWYVREPYLPMEQPFAAKDIPERILKTTTSGPWNKIYKRSFIEKNKLQFQPLPNTNDLFFVLMSLMLAERIAWTSKPLVSYRRGMATNTQSRREQAPRAFYEALKAVRDELIKKELYDAFEYAYLDFARTTCDFNFKAISLQALSVEERIEIETSLGLKSNYENVTRYPKGPKISICVAVYNTSEYLRACMDSLIKQTYKSIEIICVNDGSTDNSLDILNEYAKRDKRVIVVDKEKNEKLMLARVSALDVATGDYIVFVDSDDYLDHEAMDVLAGAIMAHDVDLIQYQMDADVQGEDKSYANWFKKNCSPVLPLMTGPDYLNNAYNTRRITTSLLGKIYRAEMIKKAYASIKREEVYVGEDVYAMFYIALHTHNSVGVSSKPLYHYRYGLGVSNVQAMSLEKFSLYCNMSHLVDNVREFLQGNSYSKLQLNAWLAMGNRLLDDVLNIIVRGRLEEEDIHAAELMIAQAWHKFPDAANKIMDVLGKNITQLLNEAQDVPVYVKEARCAAQDAEVPAVSVIIPAFNCEEYLRDCLESVLQQKSVKYEIILINDGSLDDTLSIMEEYYQQYDNIALISKYNGGQSAARNDAIKLARGKYILFLDSDDMQAENCMSILTEYADEQGLDFLGFDADTFYDMDEADAETFISFDSYYHRQNVYTEPVNGLELMCVQQRNHEYRVSPCMMLLQREWLLDKQITFEEGIIFEDNLFTYCCYLNAERCAHVAENLYLRRMRAGSTVTSQSSMKHVRSYFTCYLQMTSELRKANVSHEEYPEVQWIAKNLLTVATRELDKLIAAKKFVAKSSFDHVMYALLNSNRAAAAPAVKPAAAAVNAKASNGVAAYTLDQVPALPNKTDLNTITQSGTYLVLHNGKDKVIENCPTRGTYKLSVDVLTNKVLRQTLIAGNSYNTFVRSQSYGKWSEWVNIAGGNGTAGKTEHNRRGAGQSFFVRAIRKLVRVFRRNDVE